MGVGGGSLKLHGIFWSGLGTSTGDNVGLEYMILKR